jgi:hypothetical protein
LLEDSLDKSKLLDDKVLLVSGLMFTEESIFSTGALLTAGNAGAAMLTGGSATGGAMTGLAATMLLGGSTGGLVTGLKLAAGGTAGAGLAAMAALDRAGVALVPRLAKAVSVGLLAVVVPSLALFSPRSPPSAYSHYQAAQDQTRACLQSPHLQGWP